MEYPKGCYVLIMGTEVGVVKWGERGYYKTDYPSGYSQEDIDHFNNNLGVSKEEADIMKICSMANLPETNAAWEKHYDKCINIWNKHNKEDK